MVGLCGRGHGVRSGALGGVWGGAWLNLKLVRNGTGSWAVQERQNEEGEEVGLWEGQIGAWRADGQALCDGQDPQGQGWGLRLAWCLGMAIGSKQ